MIRHVFSCERYEFCEVLKPTAADPLPAHLQRSLQAEEPSTERRDRRLPLLLVPLQATSPKQQQQQQQEQQEEEKTKSSSEKENSDR